MYESFFGMEHTPFVRDVPPEKLYESNAFRETLGRLSYVADRQMFAVVTADPGCGKSTLIRRFCSELPKEDYIVLYLSDLFFARPFCIKLQKGLAKNTAQVTYFIFHISLFPS